MLLAEERNSKRGGGVGEGMVARVAGLGLLRLK
jgi:hypothetical protein